MAPGMLIFVAAAIVAVTAFIAYWRGARGGAKTRRAHSATFVLLAAGLGFCGWSLALEEPDHRYMPPQRTVAIAIAFDLSPSMLAIPDPIAEPDIPPRFVRARDTLLELSRQLSQQRVDVLVSLLGFTRKAEILMGWDDSPSQFREILQYGLSPNLFTSSGTRIEAAIEALVDVFGMLPEESRTASRRIAILVSDGEDTLPRSYLDYALEQLAESSFEIIALHTGLVDASEGVPRYGQVGEFLGFETMSGRHYTVPDAGVMTAIAAATEEPGLYVRAEADDAAGEMLRFIGQGAGERGALDYRLLAALGLFAVVAAFCARVLR